MKPLRNIFSRRAKDSRDRGVRHDNHQNNLPRWNISQIYRDIDSPALKKDITRVERMIDVFRKNHEKCVASLNPEEFGAAIVSYENIQALRNKIFCYAELLHADDRANHAKLIPLNIWLRQTEKSLSFFESEIADMREGALLRTMTNPVVSQYAPWIARVRAGAEYILDAPTEDKICMLDKDQEALVKKYHDTITEIKILRQGNEYNVDTAHNHLKDIGVSEIDTLRQEIGAELKKHAPDIALLYNQITSNNLAISSLRGYARADHETNLENGLADKTVDQLYQSTKRGYQKLSQRFYSWKAGQCGVQQLNFGQLVAPIPGLPEEKSYNFAQAKKIVLNAFGYLSPQLEKLARRFFNSHHIDAEVRDGKESGAFALPAGPDDYPYVMLNYTDSLGDIVGSLGHELGHGVHFALSEKTRGFFLSENTTILCETASIFAEMLVYDELIRCEKDPAAQRMLKLARFEGILENALQQIAYHDFEVRVHAERKTGPLNAERISDIWLETQTEFFGPAVKTDEYLRYYWMVVPHFFDTPFYVYSYAFAQHVVNGLYQDYQQSSAKGTRGHQEFAEKYIELLRTGVTKDLYQTLRPFHLNPETPEFWDKSIRMMESQLEDIINPPVISKPKHIPRKHSP